MSYNGRHPSRRELLLLLDGELAAADAAPVRQHLETCAECREISRDLDAALAGVLRLRNRDFPVESSAAVQRAQLQARLAELPSNRPALPHGFTWAAAACLLLATGLLLSRWNPPHAQAAVVSLPDPALTPGAATPASRLAVCAQSSTNNKEVPAALRHRVFQEYGLAGADPHAYEVDYLITPALGGADDIQNLWPHSYHATVWNAHVKDALEELLRQRVCDGSLDLAEAQQDIARNWIGAYKRYFHTGEPLAEHQH